MAVLKKRNNYILRRDKFLVCVQQECVFKEEAGH